MSTRWKSLVALAAVAATPVLVAVPVGAAHGAVKHETTISIRVNDKRIDAGETSKVRGNLNIKKSNGEAGKLVTLEARAEGNAGFTPIGTAVAGPKGSIKLEVTPAVTTRYRWSFPGDDSARAGHSGVARIVVGPGQGDGSGPNRIKTTLSIRATHRPVNAGGESLVRGKLLARGIDIPNRAVLLLARTTGTGNHFAVVAMQRTDRDGVEVPRHPDRPDGVPPEVPGHPAAPRVAQRGRARRRTSRSSRRPRRRPRSTRVKSPPSRGW